MAHLAVLGSHSTNGVAAIHSELLRTRVLSDFAELFPARFNNKTNGVTPRRWLQQANPFLSQLITQAIGEAWVTNLPQLRHLLPLAEDTSFREQFRQAKRQAKAAFSDWLKATSDRSQILRRYLTVRSSASTSTSANSSTSFTSSFCTTACGMIPVRR